MLIETNALLLSHATNQDYSFRLP